MEFKIPPHYRKYITRENLIVGGVAIALGFYIYHNINMGKQDVVSGGGHVSKIFLNTEPNELVNANSFIILEGSFLDDNGKPVKVPVGYYYIFRQTGLNTGYQFVASGVLGNNISDYKVSVPTAYYQDGSYVAVVSDNALPPSVLGTGAFANPPYEGQTSFKDSGNVIKNAIPGFQPAPVFPQNNIVNPNDIPFPNQFATDMSFQ